jgi:hypothetical protein
MGWWYSPSEDESSLVTPAPGADAMALDESALSEEHPEVNEKSLVAEQGPIPGVVESEGVADTPAPEEVVSEDAVSEDAVSEDAVPAPPTTDQTDERAGNSPTENTPAESTPATTAGGGIAGFLLGAYDTPKAESGLLGGFGIIAALLTATLMAWRLPIRRYLEQATREPTTSSDSPTGGAEKPALAALTRSQERLRRVRYLRRISERR